MRKARSPPLNFSTLHQYLPPCCSQFTYILISNLGARLPTGLDHLPYANAEGEGLVLILAYIFTFLGSLHLVIS